MTMRTDGTIASETQNITIRWMEHTVYEQTFAMPTEVDGEPVDWTTMDLGDVHEYLDDSGAWDLVDWLKSVVEVTDREIHDVKA